MHTMQESSLCITAPIESTKRFREPTKSYRAAARTVPDRRQRTRIPTQSRQQARLDPLALSASGRESAVNGCAAASGEEKFDFPLTGVRRGSPDCLQTPAHPVPGARPNRRSPAGVRVGDLSFGRRGGKVGRTCHNLVRDCESSGKLFPARSLARFTVELQARRGLLSFSRGEK